MYGQYRIYVNIDIMYTCSFMSLSSKVPPSDNSANPTCRQPFEERVKWNYNSLIMYKIANQIRYN